jgi:hypothetical protein
MCRGFWFVPISLSEEKYGADNTLYFIYDTGASTTYVDRSALVMSPVIPAQLP